MPRGVGVRVPSSAQFYLTAIAHLTKWSFGGFFKFNNMDITTKHTDELNATVNIKLTKEDLEPNVNKSLKEIRKTAQIKGFRPGKAPLGLIKKMYGENVMAEELNKLVSKSLNDHIENEKMDILLQPMAAEEAPVIDSVHVDEFTFMFDIALKPKFELKLDKDIKLTRHEIEITDKEVDESIEQIKRNFAEMQDGEEIEDTAFIKADIVELDAEGKPVEGGISNKDSSFGIKFIKNEEVKKNFIGAKVGEERKAKMQDVLSGDNEIAEVLGIEKEDVGNYVNEFSFTVKSISNFVDAEINEELFQKVFPTEEIKTEEEFRAKIKESIEKNSKHDTDYRLQLDAKDYLLDNINFDLPEEFLKRWLIERNADKENVEETVNEEFDNLLKSFRWQLIMGEIAKQKELAVDKHEIEDFALNSVRMQFAQYGLSPDQIGEEELRGYANNMILGKEGEKERIYDQILEDKTLREVVEVASIETKQVSVEEFNKLSQPEPAETKEEK